MTKKPNTAQALVSKMAWMFFMLIPTAVSIFLAVRVQQISNELDTVHVTSDIICFSPEQCVLYASGKWFVVVDVIDPDDIPTKFRIDYENLVVEDTLSIDTE